MTFDVAKMCETPPVMLAPMAGITDLPFRDLVQDFGVDLVVSEMIASQDVINARPGTAERAALGLGDAGGRTAVQLAGREPRWMAEAARMIADGGAGIIDINMGCPAKKVTNGWSGSALMRTPDHALRLIEAVTGAVALPVTLKTRLGWDDTSLNAAHIAERAVAAGVRMVTIHGRTRCQFYTGRADWAAIAATRAAIPVPVIANGDIAGPGDARAALALSGARGVMIGRAVRGQPWLPAQVRAALAGRAVPPAPRGAQRAAIVARHYEAMLSFYGTALGLRVARKHLGWYMDRAGTPGALRREIVTATDPRAVLSWLDLAMDWPHEAAA